MHTENERVRSTLAAAALCAAGALLPQAAHALDTDPLEAYRFAVAADAAYESDAATRAAMLQAAGLAEFEYDADVAPGWGQQQMLVATHAPSKTAILAFAGSKLTPVGVIDWLLNADMRLVDVDAGTDLHSTCGGCKVHKGFNDRASSIFENSQVTVLEWLRQGWIDNEHIVFVGHSLGGSLAQLIAAYVAAEDDASGDRVDRVVTFASPMVGNQAFADTYEGSRASGNLGLYDATTRWVIHRDFGPLYPRVWHPVNNNLANDDYREAGPKNFLEWTGSEYTVDYDRPADLQEVTFAPPTRHLISEYTDGLYNQIVPLLGTYVRTPAQNSWHTGEILEQDGELSWLNTAGVQWSLEYDGQAERLDTQEDNPYLNAPWGDWEAFDLAYDSAGDVSHFRFMHENYYRQ